MRRLVQYIVCVVAALYISGCSALMGPNSLTLSPYRRNIVIRQDASVLIEDKTIDFRNFHKELIKRAFVDRDRIVLHVHEDVDEQVFSAVYDKLMSLGYENLKIVLYSD